ncbi:MAG: hypothetical protein ABII13_04610 [Patescibacteria group bacterium]
MSQQPNIEYPDLEMIRAWYSNLTQHFRQQLYVLTAVLTLI